MLELDQVDVAYGRVQVLRSVSIRIEPAEMVALIGANGAGKTTTLRAISGIAPVRSGRISIGGREVEKAPAYARVRLGLAHLPEGRDLFTGLSVLENLRLGSWVRRRDRAKTESTLEEVLDLFPRLRERAHQRASTLSGGEQQMLGVGRALMSRPRLLLVDELSLGLAPLVVGQLFEALEAVRERGTSILLVEQFVHMALRHTNRAYVLARGQVVIEGPSDQLFDDPELVATYLGSTA